MRIGKFEVWIESDFGRRCVLIPYVHSVDMRDEYPPLLEHYGHDWSWSYNFLWFSFFIMRYYENSSSIP